MNRHISACLAIVMLAMLFDTTAFAQCCGAGNPISTSHGDAMMKKNQLQIMLGYRHSSSDRYYEGSHSSAVDFPGKIRHSGYDFSELGISFGVTRRLTVGASVGYFLDKSEDYVSDIFPDLKSYGFGDLSIRGSYSVFRNVRRGFEVAPFVMVKIPIGKFDCESDGIKLPLAMQPSSGSFKYSIGISASCNINSLLYVTTFDQFEFSQRIKSRNFDYQYGPLWNLNVGLKTRPMKNLHAGIQLGYEDKGKAKNDGWLLDGSEYRLIKLTPQIMGLYRNLQVTAGMEVPVWRKVGGIQMSNSWALQLNLAYNIKL